VFSALFGHRRGAYTGAGGDRAGVLEACHGGAVFLDEVADLPMPAQVALLRSLQEGTVRPLGADASRPAAPRIISATHRDLAAMVREGGFRVDLYHRLSSVVLTVPALRERPEDLPVLAEAVLREVEPQLRPLILERFEAFRHGVGAGYHWPGNVRELAAVLRTLALGLTPRLLAGGEPSEGRFPPGLEDGQWSLDAVKRWYAQYVADLHPTRTAAARALDIDRSTLRGLLKS
jgi:DNA-binding NtrC family response regulator